MQGRRDPEGGDGHQTERQEADAGAQTAASDVTPARRDLIPSQIAMTAHATAPYSATGTTTPIHSGLCPAFGIHA